MPFPLLPVLIGAGLTAYAGRKLHDNVAEHPPLRGYCSNCGSSCSHSFHTSGMNWKKTGGMALALGAAGIGLGSLLWRNVYECSDCGSLTLRCRVPGCTGMARSGDYYDDELCGQCSAGNDNSKLYKAYQDQKELAKVRRIQRNLQTEVDELRSKVEALERDRRADKQLVRDLTRLLRAKETELHTLRSYSGAA